MPAFWVEPDLVVHEEFRQGGMAPQSDALNFLKDTVAQLPKTVMAQQSRNQTKNRPRIVLINADNHSVNVKTLGFSQLATLVVLRNGSAPFVAPHPYPSAPIRAISG